MIHRSLGGRVETLFASSIAAIDDSRGRVALTFDDGSQRTFGLLIGADGLHSNAFRRLVFESPAEQFERHIGYYVSAFTARGYRPRDELAYVSYGRPGRQISRFALSDDRTMFLLVFAADRLRGPEPGTLSERKSTVRYVFAEVEWEWPRIQMLLDASGDIYFDRVSQVQTRAWSKGAWRSSATRPPASRSSPARGTGLGVTGAYVLAGELARRDGNHQFAFADYERRLRPLIEGKQRAARSFARAFTPRTSPGVWLRNQAMKLMAFPACVLVGAQMPRDDFGSTDAFLVAHHAP